MWKTVLLLLLASLIQGQESGDPTTAVSGTTSTAKQEGVSTTPATTSSTAPPTTTLQLTTIDVDNDKQPIDGKLLLQRSLALSNQVKSLTEEIYSLEAAVNATNSPYLAQLTQMQTNATRMQERLSLLTSSLDNLNERQEEIDRREQNLTRIYKCFAESQCVTEKPTTTTTTTVMRTTTMSTTPPTTPPPLNACPTVHPQVATKANQSYVIEQQENVLCSDMFSASSGVVVLYVNATIKGNGASLSFSNGRTGQAIQSINQSTVTTIHSNVSDVKLTYAADVVSSVALDIMYYMAEQTNPCDDYRCQNNGTCQVVPSTGLPMCICSACSTGDKCQSTTDPCTSATAKRRCRLTAVPPDSCSTDDSQKEYCAYKCNCQVKVSDTQCGAPSVSLSFQSSLWNFWKKVW